MPGEKQQIQPNWEIKAVSGLLPAHLCQRLQLGSPGRLVLTQGKALAP